MDKEELKVWGVLCTRRPSPGVSFRFCVLSSVLVSGEAQKESMQERSVRETKAGKGQPAWLSAAPSSTPLQVAGLAEEVVIQRVAALVSWLHRQEHTAVLTTVTVFVEAPSHALNFEGILPVSGDDGILTDAAHRCKLPVEVSHTVHPVLVVQCEVLIPDAPGTGHTGKAGWVEGLAQGPDHVVSDNLSTLITLLQSILVAGFTQGASILLIESLPGQLAAAGATGEALGMVLPLHGLNSQLSRGHRLVTEATDICGQLLLWKVDRLFWRRR